MLQIGAVDAQGCGERLRYHGGLLAAEESTCLCRALQGCIAHLAHLPGHVLCGQTLVHPALDLLLL